MIKKELLSSLDMSTTGSDALVVSAPLSANGAWSLQAVWSGLDAIDAVISINQSNDGVNFSPLSGSPTLDLDSVSGNEIVEDTVFSCAFIQISLSSGTVTEGTLSVILVARDY